MCVYVCWTVAGEGYLDADESGTLVWDPKVVENLTDKECKCIIVLIIIIIIITDLLWRRSTGAQQRLTKCA